jgi:hypothetical protein
VCEHAFVPSKGTPHGRFTRAIERRNLLDAEAAARELGVKGAKTGFTQITLLQAPTLRRAAMSRGLSNVVRQVMRVRRTRIQAG